jgi:hypothetical protein
MPRDSTETSETSEGKCEFCGDGPECAVCGRGKPEPATVATKTVTITAAQQRRFDELRRLGAEIQRLKAAGWSEAEIARQIYPGG